MSRLVNTLIVSILFLSGCKHNYTFLSPALKVENRWTVPISNRSIEKKHIERDAWWTSFHDEKLNELIKQSFACNNDLNQSRGEIAAAQGELEKIHYQWIPTLDSMIGYSRNPATGFPGMVAVLIPNYTLNAFYQIKEEQRAKYELAVENAKDDALKLTVISEVTASYFTYQAEIERKRLLQQLADDSRELAQISDSAFKGGIESDITPQNRYSDADTIYGEQQVLERNIVYSRNAIRYLINKNPGDITTQYTFSHISTDHLIPGQLPITVLETRPDMRVAENQLRASNESIDLAASNWLPSIQLDLIKGVAAGNSNYTMPRSPVYFNDQLLKSPIFRFSILGEVAKAKGLNQAAFYRYMGTLKKALRDTTNALAAHDRLTKKLKQSELSRTHLAEAYDLNDRLYKRGIQSYGETLHSKILLDKANIQVNQDKLAQLLTIVHLYKEIGGGYQWDEASTSMGSNLLIK